MRIEKYFGGNNLLHLCNENKLADMKDKIFWKRFDYNNFNKIWYLTNEHIKSQELNILGGTATGKRKEHCPQSWNTVWSTVGCAVPLMTNQAPVCIKQMPSLLEEVE